MKKDNSLNKQLEKIERHLKSRRINYYHCDNNETTKTTLVDLIAKFCLEQKISKLGYIESNVSKKINLYSLIKDIPNIDIKKPIKNNINLEKLNINDSEKYINLIREYSMVDIFISFAEGITLRGEILLADNMGNKIAATVFGPKRVIILVGKNNVYKDIDQFLDERNGKVFSIIYGSMEGHKDRIHLFQIEGV